MSLGKKRIINYVERSKKDIYKILAFVEDDFNNEIATLLYCIGESLGAIQNLMEKEID